MTRFASRLIDSPRCMTIYCILIILLISTSIAHSEEVRPKASASSEETKKDAPKPAPKTVAINKKPPTDIIIPKILEMEYDNQSQGAVVPVLTKRGFATQIFFGPGEKIEACAAGALQCAFGGDSDGWIVLAKKGDSEIELKPGLAASDTNLLVKTNLFHYAFDLRVLDEKIKQPGNWIITFHHPASALTPADRNLTLLDERLNSQMHIKRNTNYTLQKLEGSDEIIPNQAWDDGRFTFIRIPNNRSIPAIFKVASDRSESLVESHMDNDLLVVHEVAPRWVLRLSNQVVGIWNESFDPDGVAPVNGTTIPGVARIAKEATK